MATMIEKLRGALGAEPGALEIYGEDDDTWTVYFHNDPIGRGDDIDEALEDAIASAHEMNEEGNPRGL